MTEHEELKKRLNIEVSKNFELQRIENFLRGEVVYLREKIEELISSSEYRIGKTITRVLLINRLNQILLKIKTRKYKRRNANLDSSITSELTGSEMRIFENALEGENQKSNDAGEIDILFIQLSNNKEIGGIAQLDSIYEEFKKSSSKVQSIYMNHDFGVSTNSEEKYVALEDIETYQVRKIVFSGLESFSLIKRFDNLSAAKKINFSQGPDHLFPGNEHQFELFKESIISSTAVIAQSPYLAELAEYVGGNNIHTITLGPKETVFFDSKKNKEKVLVISTRKDPDKGLRFALPALENIRNEGWKVIGFGDLVDPSLAQYFDEHIGRVKQNELAELFQTAALILDLSSYEGLGLTVLEAGLCGVRSVVSKKGGIESLEYFKDELIFIESPLDLNEITKKIIGITVENLEEGRDKLVENARKYSWENSINKMISTINSI